MNGPLLVSTQEAAKLLGYGRREIYRLIHTYQIPFIGGWHKRKRIHIDDINKWIEHNKIRTPQDAIRMADGRRKNGKIQESKVDNSDEKREGIIRRI